ncbi:MAG: thymidine kinase [Planctomycetes bacterium]|nr:thymidine kinase [Planctomycetota bacterium]
MAKLYFRYGTVGSAKTLNLLAVAHNYERQGKKVVVMKPSLDVRDGATRVRSRAGLEREADLVLAPGTRLDARRFRGVDAVLVDEAQFLTPALVDQLRELARDPGVPVLCYGLRTDFRSHLFEGSRRLLEVADTIEEVKTTCASCNRKAMMNLRLVDGRPTTEGPSVQLGGDESYRPVCWAHYHEATDPIGGAPRSRSAKRRTRRRRDP